MTSHGIAKDYSDHLPPPRDHGPRTVTYRTSSDVLWIIATIIGFSSAVAYDAALGVRHRAIVRLHVFPVARVCARARACVRVRHNARAQGHGFRDAHVACRHVFSPTVAVCQPDERSPLATAS